MILLLLLLLLLFLLLLFSPYLLDFFYYMYVYVCLSMGMCMMPLEVLYPLSWTYRWLWVACWECWEQNTGPQQEQCMLVTSKLTLLSLFFLKTVSPYSPHCPETHCLGLRLQTCSFSCWSLLSSGITGVCYCDSVSVAFYSLAWSHLGWAAFWCTLVYTSPLPLFLCSFFLFFFSSWSAGVLSVF